MELIKLTDKSSPIVDIIIKWNYNWWGNDRGLEIVKRNMIHSLNEKTLPQTYVVIDNNVPLGMFQIAYADDLEARPDLTPWLIDLYVDEEYRGNGVFKYMMKELPKVLENIGIKRLYLYTKHDALYDKYGFKHISNEPFNKEGDMVKLYELDLKR